MLEVTLRHGLIGCNPKQRKTVKALGFKKVNSTKTFPDSPSIRGMLRVVQHLVEVNEK